MRFTEAAKHRVALNIVRLWQEAKLGFAGRWYVNRILTLVYKRILDSDREGRPPVPITAVDLPPLQPTTKPTKPKD